MLSVLLIRLWRRDRCSIGRGRLVRQRSRYAARITSANLLTFVGLARTQYCLRGIAVWLVLLFGLFFVREINLRGNLSVDVTVTHDRRQDGFNTALYATFDIRCVF